MQMAKDRRGVTEDGQRLAKPARDIPPLLVTLQEPCPNASRAIFLEPRAQTAQDHSNLNSCAGRFQPHHRCRSVSGWRATPLCGARRAEGDAQGKGKREVKRADRTGREEEQEKRAGDERAREASKAKQGLEFTHHHQAFPLIPVPLLPHPLCVLLQNNRVRHVTIQGEGTHADLLPVALLHPVVVKVLPNVPADAWHKRMPQPL